jgi:hypothetical protein
MVIIFPNLFDEKAAYLKQILFYFSPYLANLKNMLTTEFPD